MAESNSKPGNDDPSRPERSGDYPYKRNFYRSSEVAEDYDFHRFGSRARRRRNRAKWAAVKRALGHTRKVRTILDMPCGTGRFSSRLADLGYYVLASDISMQMLEKAAQSVDSHKRVGGFCQAEAEHLPLPTRSIDCIVCIRFMFHVNARARHKILCEMRRVSRRWIIVDYRHKHSYRYKLYQWRKMLGLDPAPLKNRVTREGLEREFRAAGLSVRRIIPVARFFSDKWIVLAEAPSHSTII